MAKDSTGPVGTGTPIPPTAPAMTAPAPATPSTEPARPPDPPLTAWRFVGALALTCLLFFVLLVVMALAGLGPLGVAPAIVVAVTLTGRLAHVRRPLVLVALGALAFLIVVVGSMAAAIAVVLNNPQLGS